MARFIFGDTAMVPDGGFQKIILKTLKKALGSKIHLFSKRFISPIVCDLNKNGLDIYSLISWDTKVYIVLTKVSEKDHTFFIELSFPLYGRSDQLRILLNEIIKKFDLEAKGLFLKDNCTIGTELVLPCGTNIREIDFPDGQFPLKNGGRAIKFYTVE